MVGSKKKHNIRGVVYNPCVALDVLGDGFSDIVEPATFPRHVMRYRNDILAERLGLLRFAEHDEDWISHFARFDPLPDTIVRPRAMRYHGHQFQYYNPDIGDGRGFSFAQMYNSVGELIELGTKGSGTTPYSRSGDGRLTLKGAVREIIATEMLSTLGVKTSQTLSVIETGEQLDRNDEPSPTRSAVLVRAGRSHIRIGSFQRLAFEDRLDQMQQLVDYVVDDIAGLSEWQDLAQVIPIATGSKRSSDTILADELLPVTVVSWMNAKCSLSEGGLDSMQREATKADSIDVRVCAEDLSVVDRCVALFAMTLSTVAKTCAQWTAAGFVHGVLNTDNINIVGESFDYGPYRFLPYYDPSFVAAYFDHRGLYAFGRQADACMWNLNQLLISLSTLISEDIAKTHLIPLLKLFPTLFERQLITCYAKRLSLEFSTDSMIEVGTQFLELLLRFLGKTRIYYEGFFLDWRLGAASETRAASSPRAAVYKCSDFTPLRDFIRTHSRDPSPSGDGQNRVSEGLNPPDCRIDNIEFIWSAIDRHDDWTPLENLVDQIRGYRIFA